MLILNIRAVHSGGAKGAVAPARKTKCFFSNIVSDFAGLFLVAILVRNLTKTEFAPADKNPRYGPEHHTLKILRLVGLRSSFNP